MQAVLRRLGAYNTRSLTLARCSTETLPFGVCSSASGGAFVTASGLKVHRVSGAAIIPDGVAALPLAPLSLSPFCSAIRGKGCCVGSGAMNATKTAAAMAAILVDCKRLNFSLRFADQPLAVNKDCCLNGFIKYHRFQTFLQCIKVAISLEIVLL